MHRERFIDQIDEYLKDVRAESVRLFESGVLSEHCLKIAEQVADSRATKRALERQALTGMPAGLSRVPKM